MASRPRPAKAPGRLWAALLAFGLAIVTSGAKAKDPFIQARVSSETPEPARRHADQQRVAAERLEALEARTGLTRPTLTGDRPLVNPWAEERTTAGLLGEAGYMTALSGKWHLGEADGSQPQQVGYDEYLGILSIVSEFTQGLDVRRYPELIHKPARMAA